MAAPSNVQRLQVIKFVHTVIWAFLASCAFAIPIAAAVERYDYAWIASAIMAGELIVLAVNRGHCPITAIAARYTRDRRKNFDIYLPLWLATYNKYIFGTVLVAGNLYLFARWMA
jgi:hypothetical protein